MPAMRFFKAVSQCDIPPNGDSQSCFSARDAMTQSQVPTDVVAIPQHARRHLQRSKRTRWCSGITTRRVTSDCPA
jgi:hypothetical protein